MRFSVGTAQFGRVYGIANKMGRPSEDSIKKIISCAQDAGVDSLDTASDYGMSEKILGNIGVEAFRVTTKLPVNNINCCDISIWIKTNLNKSLKRLKLDSIHALLLHRTGQIDKSNATAILNAVESSKDKGLIKKFGVSIYDPSELDSICKFFEPDIVQAPFNLLDRRLLESGWMERLKNRGVELHTRSTFLQGLLLLPRSKIPPKFEKWKNAIDLCIFSLYI